VVTSALGPAAAAAVAAATATATAASSVEAVMSSWVTALKVMVLAPDVISALSALL
jgi:hypothetical protein